MEQVGWISNEGVVMRIRGVVRHIVESIHRPVSFKKGDLVVAKDTKWKGRVESSERVRMTDEVCSIPELGRLEVRGKICVLVMFDAIGARYYPVKDLARRK